VVTVVGDAVGHGLVAAAAMGQLRASIATAVANDPDPSRAIAAVDLFAVQGADTIGASGGLLPLRTRRAGEVRQRGPLFRQCWCPLQALRVAGGGAPSAARIPVADNRRRGRRKSLFDPAMSS
jgi:hypothetical protein